MSSNSPLSQKNLAWANIGIGSSPYLIHARGSALTVLAEILGLTPDTVNEKLKEVDGFSVDLPNTKVNIIWEKIMVAFPGWSAQFIEPYNNDIVLDALSKGRGVIVFIGEYGAVRYMGGGICHDPLDGTEKPTSTYPDVRGFVVLTHVEPVVEEPVVEPISEPVISEYTDGTINLQTPLSGTPQEPPVEYTSPVVAETVTRTVNKTLLKHVKRVKKELQEIEKLLK